jgi:outer membrane protein TolC
MEPLFAADQFLNTCLQIVQTKDKKLLVAKEQLGLAKARVLRSGRAFLPSIMWQYRQTLGSNNVTEKLALNSSVKTLEQYIAKEEGFKITQTLFEGGRLRALYRYDVLMEEAARYNFTKTREELFYKIKVAYYEYLSLKVEYTALQKAFAEIDNLMKKIRIEYKAKAIAELDLIEAQNYHDKLSDLFDASRINYTLAEKKLLALLDVDSFDQIPMLPPEGLSEDVPEISFTLDECKGFVIINNLDIKAYQIQILMAEQKRKMARSKILPKFYLDYFSGSSGEAFKDGVEVTDYGDIPTAETYSWSVRMAWGLWGNSLEMTESHDKTNPNEIIEPTARTENHLQEVRISLLDDLNYFVEAKESKLSLHQAEADYDDLLKKVKLDYEKVYNEYISSLNTAKTSRDEIGLRRRKLDLLRKKNELYEVPTVQVMEESWKYAEAISAYEKALSANYTAVAEMEKMTLMPLR